MHPRPLRPHALLAALLLVTAAAFAQEALPAAAPREFTVAPADLASEIRLDGLLAAAHAHKVWFTTGAFGGQAEVAGILPSGSLVAQGQILLELSADELDRELVRARQEADDAKTDLQLLADETAVREDEQKRRLADLEQKLARAVREQESYEKLGGPRTLEGAALGVRRAEHNLEDQKEELAQLEGMYKKSALAGETQEIVLQRARRDVASSEISLKLTRADEEIVRVYNHPDRVRELASAVDDRAAELARERESIRIAQARRLQETAKAKLRVQDADERLGKLRRDRESLKMNAPAAGVFVHSLEEGEMVKAGQPLYTLHEVAHLTVAADADAPLLRTLNEGAGARVAPEDFPELVVNAKVSRIGLLGKPSEGKGKPARFPVEIALDAAPSFLRPGMRCAVIVAGPLLKGVLAVPRTALKTDAAGVVTCKVRAAQGATERKLFLGAGDGERVQVLSGLAAGDVVLLPEGESK